MSLVEYEKYQHQSIENEKLKKKVFYHFFLEPFLFELEWLKVSSAARLPPPRAGRSMTLSRSEFNYPHSLTLAQRLSPR